MTELLHRELTYEIIGGALEVHNELGPGFLESTYQRAMEIEPVGDHVLDLVVDGRVVVELKAVTELGDHHRAQVISYLKASHLQVGLLFNFSKISLEHKRILLSEVLMKSA